jgi:phage tail sheath protein FI
MSSNALFKFVNTRAILNVLLDVLARSFDDVLFEQIDSAGTLYARAKSIASQVMGQLYRQGALFGARPEQAYLVVCSDANNAVSDLENGTLRLDAYVATSPTLERLVVTVVRTPAGQVAQVQDTFSRNVDRFDYLLNATTV